jgi:uncharacterized MAPEG superfamily protein
MRIELTMLGASLVLAIVQIGLAGHFRTRDYGTKWNTGARDEQMPPLSPLAGRFVRAQANLFETLPLFIGAVLACAVTSRFDARSAWGAQIFFWARVAYVPLYAAGVPVVRSLVFLVATGGLLMVIWSLMFG